MTASKYFLATLLLAGLTLLAVTFLAIRTFRPAYDLILTWCGQAVSACQRLLTSVDPLGLMSGLALIWLSVILLAVALRTNFMVRRITRNRYELPSSIQALVFRLGLAGRVEVVGGQSIFCSGFFSPKIFIGRDILTRFSTKEIEAILRHESYHLRSRDPLKVWLGTSLSRALFFVPAIGELNRQYLREKELAADREAESLTGRAFLARALYKVIEKTRPENLAIASAVPSFAAEWDRVRALRGERVHFRINSWAWTVSLFALMFMAVSIFKAGTAAAGCL